MRLYPVGVLVGFGGSHLVVAVLLVEGDSLYWTRTGPARTSATRARTRTRRATRTSPRTIRRASRTIRTIRHTICITTRSTGAIVKIRDIFGDGDV